MRRFRRPLGLCDNLYPYGPQTSPLTEEMPLTSYGRKPALRAEITRMWKRRTMRAACVPWPFAQAISTAGRADVRDCTFGIARLLAGKPALAPYNPDYTPRFYLRPDFARALVSLTDAPTMHTGKRGTFQTRTLRVRFVKC